MSETRIVSPVAHPPRMKLSPYSAEIRLTNLVVGLDNIHYDVFLSPRFVEFTRKYILALIRQSTHISLMYTQDWQRRKSGAPEHAAFRKMLTEILETSLTRAKFLQSIETDVLHHVALLKFFIQEIGNQFSSILVEGKDWIRSRGENFEHSEQAHVMRSKIAEVQADRKNVIREVGDTVCHIWREVEDNTFAKTRRALFGEDFHETYQILQNRCVFVEGGSDDNMFLEHYIVLGNFMNDPDRFDAFDSLLLEFVRDCVLSGDSEEDLTKARNAHERLLEQARLLRSEIDRIEAEQDGLGRRSSESEDSFPWPFRRKQGASPESRSEAGDLDRKSASLEKNLNDLAPHIDAAKQRMEFLAAELQNRIGDYLNEPANARRLFDVRSGTADGGASPETRARLLEEWVNRLEERDLLIHVFAGYELKKIVSEYSPPVHLQQLKKALVNRDEAKRVEQILEQFPARKVSMKRLDESARAIRRRSHEEALAASLQFAEDFMRLRRDRRNYQQVAAWMERINLVRSERSRELSRANKSLYEFLHPSEGRPTEDAIINHVVIKADVRGSTRITKDLLERGLNPASHFSMALHEPVKRMLERYGAAKVFIEGDAIILAIYETESTRTTQRAVAKACVLAREILAVTAAYNVRAKTGNLPPLELGVGVAFQDSAPSLWMDADSKIMISRALNLSDRLSSCSKMAKRLFKENPAPFNVYMLQTLMEDAVEDEGEELLVRYNLNGIELNDEGFQKLSAEISLSPMAGSFPLPWGKERVQLFFGEVPIGESLERIIIRKGFVRQLLPGGKIGAQGTRPYYEVCTDPRLVELALKKLPPATES